MTNFYMTKEHGIATDYLREHGLNTITWEYFVGDFDGTLRYLEKVANHIWDSFEIDETEIFASIFKKNVVKGWDKKYLPNTESFYHCTHIHMSDDDCFGNVEITPVTVSELKYIEYNLILAIVDGLNNK